MGRNQLDASDVEHKRNTQELVIYTNNLSPKKDKKGSQVADSDLTTDLAISSTSKVARKWHAEVQSEHNTGRNTHSRTKKHIYKQMALHTGPENSTRNFHNRGLSDCGGGQRNTLEKRGSRKSLFGSASQHTWLTHHNFI